MAKIAVVLFNLGGPDKPESIRPFLLNFFSDPNIIRAPKPIRWCVARLIAYRRSKREAGDSYGILGGKSPLLENTQIQAQALQITLENSASGHDYKTFIAMRYWHPMANETVEAVKAFAPDEIVLLPLYPQYSTTTTRSSLQDWQRACNALGLNCPTSTVCCYPFAEGFVKASVARIRAAYDAAQITLKEKNLKPVRVLFSAHGLPESVIKEGDPYQWQCEECARQIVEALGLPNLDWQICYQSRVGPMKWIGPSTEEALRQAARDQVPVLVYPHAFVNEHVETLVEIEHEYRELADEIGVPWFGRVETVGDEEHFIAGLAAMVKRAQSSFKLAPDSGQRVCPKEFCQCATQEFAAGV